MTRGRSGHRALLLVCLFLACLAEPARAAAPPGRSLPAAAYEPADARLERPIAVREERVTIGDLLARLAQETGVPLACDPSVAAVEVVIQAKSRPAREVLGRLAVLLDRSWGVVPAERGAAAGFRLNGALRQPSAAEVQRRLLDQEEAVGRFECEAAREPRAACLGRYRAALQLPRDQLLAVYEADHPWVCADLLTARTRVLLDVLPSLTPGRTEKLLADGSVGFPLADLPPECRRHLGEWARGLWGAPGGASASLSPDTPPRFERWEDRWPNSVVFLVWTPDALKLELAVPDVYRFDADIAHLSGHYDTVARRRLAALRGTRPAEDASRPAGGAAPAPTAESGPQAQAGAPPPAEAHAALRVDLSSLAGKRVAISQVLALIAEQTGVPIIGCPGPAEDTVAIPKAGRGPRAVEEVLDLLRTARRGLWSAEFADGWLVVRDEGGEVSRWGALPDGLVGRWQARMKQAAPVPLDEVADLVAGLNPLQVERLRREAAQFKELPLYHLRLYGGLEANQRRALRRGETVSISSLSPEQQRLALLRAQATHPWFGQSDLDRAVLRLVPETLCTEEGGMAMLMEYNRRDSPRDRDVLFVVPDPFRPVVRAPED